MPYHCWGDEDFEEGWGQLSHAQEWMSTMYRRKCGKNMMTKEKYGTIRYEYTFLWMKTTDQSILFFEIVKRAIDKFPSVAGEIVCDVVSMIDPIDIISARYKGYFEAVLWLKSKSKWSN